MPRRRARGGGGDTGVRTRLPRAEREQQTLAEARALFAQRGYADMRGNWAKKCLELHGRRVVERAETIEGVEAGRELGKWVENLLNVVEVTSHPWSRCLSA